MVFPVPGAQDTMPSEPGSRPAPRKRSRSGSPVRSRPMSASIFADQEGRGVKELPPCEGVGETGVGGGAQVGIAADDQDRDHRGLRIGPEALDQLESIHGWHHDISGHEVRMPGLNGLQSCRAVARLGHTVAGALENQAHHEPDVRFVIDDKNPGQRSSLASSFVRSEPIRGPAKQRTRTSSAHFTSRLLDETKFDLVIIGADTESPIDPEALKEIRALARAPLIILDETYKGALETYEAGAEQILPKPFVPDGLIGAIKVELRGPSPSSLVPLATRIELGGLVFDAERRIVQRGETEVRFTQREWEVLAFFLASPNQYFRAEEILAQTWGTDASAEQLRTYITRMRQKLSPFEAWCNLITEKGRGYCLVLEGAADKP